MCLTIGVVPLLAQGEDESIGDSIESKLLEIEIETLVENYAEVYRNIRKLQLKRDLLEVEATEANQGKLDEKRGEIDRRLKALTQQKDVILSEIDEKTGILDGRHANVQPKTLASGERWKRVSPFTAVSLKVDGRVEVEFERKAYWLISIDDLPTGEILASSQRQYGQLWEKRFVEDIAEVLAGMGSPPGTTVKLVLRDADTGNRRIVAAAPLTRENRREVYRKYNSTLQSQRVRGSENL